MCPSKAHLEDPLRTAVSIAVNLLVNGEYQVLESLTQGHFLSAAQLGRAIDDYGRRLIRPPDSAFEHLGLVQTPDIEPATFQVAFPLWTEEGPSDLTLELLLIEAPPGRVFETQLLGLHVL
jgi:hypothetical protein